MSPSATRIRAAAINALLTLLATAFLTFGTGLWASKENTSDHKADIQAVNAKLERILDVLCQRERVRACGEGGSNGDVRIR